MPHPIESSFSALAGSLPLAFLSSVRGPEFLFFYFLWFLLVLVAMWTIRKNLSDTPLVTAAAIASFLGVGILRMLAGSSQGMQKWDGLLIMMVVGTIILLLRAEHFQNTGDGGASGCSSGASSGSGGGCGGGGGGCGGCGGD